MTDDPAPDGALLDALDDAQLAVLRAATVPEVAAWLGFSERGAAMVLDVLNGPDFDPRYES